MKKYLVLSMMLIAGFMTAQEVAPQLEAYGTLVKATYYYSNGHVQQEGFFKDGKLEGQWVSYDIQGSKNAVGEYKDGAKIGKWLFWTNDLLSEVSYDDSRIAEVRKWKQETIVQRN